MRVIARSSSIFTALCLALPATGNPSEPPFVSHDLTPLHDATRVLVNPHKGWYHHYPDNHIDKYQIARDADLLDFPGMDHLYIRLAWAYLEPKEGQFDWAVIDRHHRQVDGARAGHRLSHQLQGDQHRPHRAAVRHAALGDGGRRARRALPDGQGHRAGRTVGAGVRRPHLPRQARPLPRRLRGALRRPAVAALRGHRQHRRLGRGPQLGRQPQGVRLRRAQAARGPSPQALQAAPSSWCRTTSSMR